MKSLYACIFLWLGYLYGWAGPTTYYFKSYQVSDGLSSNTITSILQDKKGFMWFGTRNGLNRFDGTHFKVFKTDLQDSLSLGSNSILSLYEDKDEHIWVGSYNGVYIYYPKKEAFVPLPIIPKGEIRFIDGDREGNIWIISSNRLYRYTPHKRRLTAIVLKDDLTSSLHISKNGDIWIATIAGKVKRFLTQESRFESFDTQDKPINVIHAVGDSALLIGAINQTYLFNHKTKRIQPVFADLPSSEVQSHSIFHQNAATYWFGTESGMYLYDLKSKHTTILDKESGQMDAIMDNTVSSIYKDHEGGIWVGTFFGGVNYYSGLFNNFRKYYAEPSKNSISGDIVHEICKDQYGSLWIGTEDAGLNRWNTKTGQFEHFLPSGKSGGISYRNIHGLVADGDELWIGTYEHGLDVMDLKSRKVVRHYNTAMEHNFGSNFIVCLYKTKKGEILVGTWSGLYRYDRGKNHFVQLPFFNGHIQSITEDVRGTLWVGTYGNGVYFQQDSLQVSGHLEHLSGKPSIINNYVNNVYRDSNGHLWFCTEGGLSKYDPQQDKFQHYTTANGLTDNQVFRIMEDDKGLYWISTAKGLNKYDAQAKKFDHYHTAHGLPTEQFNYNSSFADSDGTMYFGTVKGMISFSPSNFLQNTFVPPLYITGLEINNRPIGLHGDDQILKKSILYTDSLTLSYDRANINFSVAALSYSIPEKNRYRYKMDGLDNEWISLEDNRKIYYTKLAPGHYVFRLKASNSDGLWNQMEKRLHITISPPFWATNFAYSLYILTFLGIVTVVFRYYYLALKAKEKERMQSFELSKEREIHHSKIDFFTNIAHEIRTPLTLIKMPLDKLIKQHEGNEQTNESLLMIEKNTDRLINLTNQLLDFRKAEANSFSLNFSKTDVNELLRAEFDRFKPAADNKALSYTLRLPRMTLHAFVDAEAMKKIIGNLLSNAIKYAQEQVHVRMLPFSSDDLLFHIEFRNDGPLIREEEQKKVFEPFYRTQESDKVSGTGIGLPLARSLAELHKGSLEITNSSDQLNTFVLSIPIHQDYELEIIDHEERKEETALDEDNLSDKEQVALPTILLVEDNTEILQYLAHELANSYRVIKSRNGQEALTQLQQEQVHLIISDIMMPVMDGIELTKAIKNDIQYSHIPLVLLTAKNSIQSKIEGLETGADAYIEKPFAFDYLLAQVNNLLASRDQLKNYFANSPLTHIKGMAYSKTDKDFLERLNEEINKYIMDSTLDVEKLSELMHMSRPTLYRKIKGISNLTPNELIHLTRLKRAAELLAEGRYKINEVAYQIGYSVPTNFSRDFQKQFGVSPSTYVLHLKHDA
ncbi:hybrid sensor histidine kinase/response regulator transcription factor [Olivibacter sitiensis]|uniref:hybrid sensor histidine kinase/response regulator transcription factor n=1 Tax=Olivibacter sitiensis TaxID=376470 RepID=UPI001FE11EF2|nr:two-component regulator propeller domain-containing protein [Olivibacter sitiensis]